MPTLHGRDGRQRKRAGRDGEVEIMTKYLLIDGPKIVGWFDTWESAYLYQNKYPHLIYAEIWEATKTHTHCWARGKF